MGNEIDFLKVCIESLFFAYFIRRVLILKTRPQYHKTNYKDAAILFRNAVAPSSSSSSDSFALN
jgi:hypothetical protein